MIISIDGPAASGKGTIAKGVAARLGLKHLDSGLFYRAFNDIQARVPMLDAKSFLAEFHKINVSRLRDENHAQAAALIATEPTVRKLINDVMRLEAKELGKHFSGVIIDGRDIGTVVFPKAAAKLFITASVEARAHRRFLEMRRRGAGVNLLEMQDDLRRRDERDRSRAVAPLVPAPDAMVIDTSDLDKDEAVAAAIVAIERAIG